MSTKKELPGLSVAEMDELGWPIYKNFCKQYNDEKVLANLIDLCARNFRDIEAKSRKNRNKPITLNDACELAALLFGLDICSMNVHELSSESLRLLALRKVEKIDITK